MVQYVIMSWLLGFSGNKLFGKVKSVKNSARWGFISCIALITIRYVLELHK